MDFRGFGSKSRLFGSVYCHLRIVVMLAKNIRFGGKFHCGQHACNVHIYGGLLGYVADQNCRGSFSGQSCQVTISRGRNHIESDGVYIPNVATFCTAVDKLWGIHINGHWSLK